MRFEPGNKYGKGRPKKPEIEELRKAIEQVQKQRKKKLLVHFVERAFEDDEVLKALAKKIVPDLTSISGEVEMKHKILRVFGMEPILPRQLKYGTSVPIEGVVSRLLKHQDSAGSTILAIPEQKHEGNNV